MVEPLITTIIPTFRRPALLKRAIESVLTQSFRNVKVCVFDNASGDDTEAVVAEYIRRDERVIYKKNEQNIGAVKNMIRGAESVCTEFYSFLADDDFLLPRFYENAIGEFERYPRADFVCARTISVDLINKRMQFRNKDWPPGVYAPSNEVASKMYNSHFVQTGVVLRRRVPQTIGSFEMSGNDILYMSMAAASSHFVVLDCYGSVFTFHSQSYSGNGGIGGEPLRYLWKALLSTVETTMRIDMPLNRKIHLLGLVMNSYSGILTKITELFPNGVRYPMTQAISLLKHAKRSMKKNARTGEICPVLPEELNEFLVSIDRDASKFSRLAQTYLAEMQTLQHQE